jgi:hypothetical protein
VNLYAELPVTETGFWVKEGIGASPDRFVGEEGLLEIKCPWAIRKDDAPDFKKIQQVPHYWHQMQAQMFVTGRKWTDFLQWTPLDHSLVRVEFDPDWFENCRTEFNQVMIDFRKLLSEVETGGPAAMLAVSDNWTFAAAEYRAATGELDRANHRQGEAKLRLIELMGDLTEVETSRLKVMQVAKKGSISWKNVASELVVDMPGDMEKYRGKSSVSIQFKIKEEKA